MSRIWLSPPHMDGAERELLLDAFDSNWIAPLGPHVDAFEAELSHWAGERPVAALSSGTAALHLALVMSGVGPGDVVVVSTFTFAATANAVRYLGADPVFVDCDPASWTLDPALLEQALRALAAEGRSAKAVIAVDLYGQLCDYAAIAPICARYGAELIEDAAESLGSVAQDGDAVRQAGSFGRFAALSFNGNKIITTSGGGALVCASEADAARARKLASQAREPVAHYEHLEVGYNYRLSNLLAAVGRGQLRGLPGKLAARRAHQRAYAEALGALPGVALLAPTPGTDPNCWLTCLTIDADVFGVDREAVRLHLLAHDIEARPLWKPMHQQPVFEGCRAVLSGASDALFRDGLCLPSGSSMTGDDRGRVIEVFLSTPGLRR